MTDPYIWPAHFPADCPPSDAVAANGIFYRLAKTNPSKPRDFRSVYEDEPERARKAIEEGRKTKCETMGLSVHADINDAITFARIFRNMGKNIVRVSLTPDSGVEIHSPSEKSKSHHTWWKPEGFDPISRSQHISAVLSERHR